MGAVTANQDPDATLRHRINELVEEEHRLERAHIGKALDGDEKARLDALAVELDRLWDLLRQRDARRRAGLDVDAAEERSASVVEGYRQ
ncbi:hypothetical protein GCM10023403_53100 [Pseudonocardia benzenivorans]|uniref:DUF2630 domain-containing protein n=1 Tax=Pseudonocardia dioxanivorans (strain ATCC 55486 / DSM 44775 / JCM 13855 / CB1190) TaxID=675635 RepID=F4CQG1_PSEUX|nr:hypothetical protein Psed_0122 [Pseudonocardia dioxanivorans CB1190]GJF02185.1 hypothetical protein PSD17_11490 [Pseudonocardia sp. D17]